MDRINSIAWFFILSILYILSIHVSIIIAVTGCISLLESIEACRAKAGPFECSASGNLLVAA